MNEILAAWSPAGVALLVLKTTALLAATWVIAILARRRSAAERHFIWLAGLVGVLLLPALAASPWRWDLPLPIRFSPIVDLESVGEAVSVEAWLSAEDPTRFPGESRDPAVPSSAESEGRTDALAAAQTRLHTPVSPAVLQEIGSELTSGPVPTTPVLSGSDTPATAEGFAPSLSGAILLLWAAIASTLLARIIAGHLQAFRHSREAEDIVDPGLVTLRRRIEVDLGTAPVRMLAGAGNEMPKAGGLLRPWLILPADAAGWPAARQESVLRHEIAHIRRRDTLWEIVASVVCALHWFNPLVWFTAARLRAEREHACDDIVLLSGTAPSDYAADLLSVARQFRSGGSHGAAAIAMAKPSRLRSRLTAVLGEQRRTSEAFGGRAGFVAAGGLPFLLMVGVASPAALEGTVPQGARPSTTAEEMVVEASRTTPASEPSSVVVTAHQVVPVEAAEPAIGLDHPVAASIESVRGLVYVSDRGESAGTEAAVANLELAFARAAMVAYQVTATLKRSEEAAPMVPARIVAAVRGNSHLERMSVGWGGTTRQPQTLSASFTFPDAAVMSAWLDSEAGRAFQAAVEEVSVAGSIRSSIASQPVH